MVNSLRTADVSARSSLLRDVSQRPSAAMNDEKRLPFAGYITRLVFGVLFAREQAPHWGGGGRLKVKKSACEASRELWSGEGKGGGSWRHSFDATDPAKIYYVKTSSFHECQRKFQAFRSWEQRKVM